MKSRRAYTLLALILMIAAMALSACVLSVSTPPAPTGTASKGGTAAQPFAAATPGAAERAQAVPSGTGPAAASSVRSTPAAFLPLVEDPATIDPSDLEHLKIAGVKTVGKPVYVAQLGSPAYLPNFGHPEAGCSWLGVAGQVFDLQQQPVKNLIVEVGGQLREGRLPGLTLTGLAPAYGPGGYEVKIADNPVASQQSLWIQLFDQSGKPLSEIIYFDSVADCDQNLILMNFERARRAARVYLPSLLKDRIPAR